MMLMRGIATAGLGLLASLASAVHLSVDLNGCNTYVGAREDHGVSAWKGMRYAAPPLGDLRFMPPEDEPCTETPQPAQHFGKVCLATGGDPDDATTDEDCLTINVWAPSNATASSKLPVYFWIHGGGFNSNSNAGYSGAELVRSADYDMVVVTFGYRLGPYGFLTDGGDTVRGNNGFLDQRKALEWVQRNIAAFGGDPDHVVLGGASAGGASVSLHLAAYNGEDRNLFVGAIGESVSFATVLTPEQSRYQFDNFAIRLGCAVPDDPVACLRGKTARELQAHNDNIPFPGSAHAPLYMWNPVADGEIFSQVTYGAFKSGKFVKVPVIMGDDTNGGTSFVPPTESTLAGGNIFLKDQFPFMKLEHFSKLDELYPNHNLTACPAKGCWWRRHSDVYGDMRYTCPGLYIAEQYGKVSSSSSAATTTYPTSGYGGSGGGARSWSYKYNVHDPEAIAAGYGVPHTVEVNALFGPDNVQGNAPQSYYPGGLNDMMPKVVQGYWTSFVRTLDPNVYRAEGTAEWGEFVHGHDGDDGEEEEEEEQKWLVFETAGVTRFEAVDEGKKEKCAYAVEIGVDIKQ